MTSFLANEGSFEERPVGDRPFVHRNVRTLKDLAYLLRWENGFDITETTNALLGISGLYGPNSTGSDGFTRIYGADMVVKWRPLETDKGWPFVIFQSEFMWRDYFADGAVDPGADPVDPADDVVLRSAFLRDYGFYAQALYGFTRGWAVGVRHEIASGSGPHGDGRQRDPFRDDRMRISPLIAWHPTHFSRVRLQYNFDIARHLASDEAHSVWLGVELLFGAHATHNY